MELAVSSPGLTHRSGPPSLWRLLQGAPARGVASGVLYTLAFPPARQAWLAWIALVPLYSLLQSTYRARSVYLAAWLGGLVFWLASVPWIWELDPGAWVAWIALSLYLSLYWPLFTALARSMLRWRVPPLAAVPTAWLACDYIQANLLSGFPWFYAAHSQYRFLALIQVSDLLGAWAVSALVVMGNVALLQVLRGLERAARPAAVRSPWKELASPAIALALVCASLGYGVFRIHEARFRKGPEVILLQSSLRQALKMGMQPQQIVDVYTDLIVQAIEVRDPPELSPDTLIVWPETSYPWGYVWLDNDLGLDAATRAGQQIFPDWKLADWLTLQRETARQLNELAQTTGAPMIVGAVFYELLKSGGQKSNAALWIDGQSDHPNHYRKIHLVPFGEYVPLVKQIPWIRILAPYDQHNLPNLVSGGKPVWFDRGAWRFAPVICFEDTVPHLVRRFFREMPDGRSPDVIVNISNDGWFNGTAEHELHLAASVFRTVEHRAPLVRAVNMGRSAVVDGNGKIVSVLREKQVGAIRHTVPLDDRHSLYTTIGDLLPQACLIVSIAFFIYTAMFRPIYGLLRNPRTP